MGPLSPVQVERFVEEGFVKVPSVVPPEHLTAGRAVLWDDLGVSPNDPTTWTEPVVRIIPSVEAPFKAAFDQPLLFAGIDQLVGPGRWLPRPHLGIFVVRFPHALPPNDTGWHIDASFAPEDYSGRPGADTDFSDWHVNVFARQRALLMLFLFSDVGPHDGPTRLRVGSHLDVPTLLHDAGESGLPAARISPRPPRHRRKGRRPSPAAKPATSMSAIRSWSTRPRRQRAGAAAHGATRSVQQKALRHRARRGPYAPVEVAILRGLGLVA